MENHYSKPIVMDNGTALSKIGFAGEDKPRYIIPTFPTSPLRKKSTIIAFTKRVYYRLDCDGKFLE